VNIPDRQRTFLTAEWRNLVMLNYVVEPTLLGPFVPLGTAMDRFEGSAYVSLIGFEFNKTQMLGHAIPFHQSFEEVNLRFYVRRGSRRGVVFIRELVPKYAVTAVARLAYGERYSCVPMSHRIETGQNGSVFAAEFSWGSGSARCSIAVEELGRDYLPAEDSLGQFITEHYWGYAFRGDRTVEYQVEHPQWTVRDAKMARFSGDAERYYGPEFAEILARSPDSAFFADGSAVTVFKGEALRD
jgi:uncharacterized protein